MVSHEDLAALQSYVTAKDTSLYSDLHEDTLMLDITHSNLKQRHIEIRFDKHTTISTLRDKVCVILYVVCYVCLSALFRILSFKYYCDFFVMVPFAMEAIRIQLSFLK